MAYKISTPKAKEQKRAYEVEQLKKNVEANKKEFEEKRMAYFVALAQQQTIEEIDRKAKTKVLAENNFKIADEWKEKRRGYYEKEAIKEPDRDFLMNEKDFAIYLELCHKERLKQGLNIPSKDLTSDYESFAILKKAEKEFVEVALKTLPDRFRKQMEEPIKTNWTHRKKFLDIALSLNTDTSKED